MSHTQPLAGLKIPKFAKLKFDPEAERRARAPAPDQWRVEYPHLARAYDTALSFARGGRITPEDFERIARGHPRRRGKGRGENRDALARSPTGGGPFVGGGGGDWSDHQSATLSGELSFGDSARNLDDPIYDLEDDPMDISEEDQDDPMYDLEDDPMDISEEDQDDPMYDLEDDPMDISEEDPMDISEDEPIYAPEDEPIYAPESNGNV